MLTPSYNKFLRALGAEGNGQRPVHGLSDFLRCPSTATINAGEAWRSQFSYMSLTLFICKMNGHPGSQISFLTLTFYDYL